MRKKLVFGRNQFHLVQDMGSKTRRDHLKGFDRKYLKNKQAIGTRLICKIQFSNIHI